MIKKVFTDNPYNEQWQLLRQYTYQDNIRKHFLHHGLEPPKPRTMETISGSLLQAEEYFKSADICSLQISPLLLYYGMSNLLYGIALLKTNRTNNINSHGMKINPSFDKRIAEVRILPDFKNKNGALVFFSEVFSPLDNIEYFREISLLDVLGWLPDLFDQYLSCYEDVPPKVIPVITNRIAQDWTELIPIDIISRFKSFEDMISNIKGFSENYIDSYYASDKFIILHRKAPSEDITVDSLFGKTYFRMGMKINGVIRELSLIICIYMGMFALSFLSRYHPKIWNPFIRLDKTGEKSMFEYFINYSKRYFPNLAINCLHSCNYRFLANAHDSLADEDNLDALREMITEIIKNEKRLTGYPLLPRTIF